jgi:CRISPR-associated protein Csa3
MILIATLGFDEKFALRSVLRNGVTPTDEIYLLMNEGGDPRSEKASNALRDLLTKGLPNLKIESVHVSLESFSVAVSKLRILMRGLRDKRIVLNLSGGQRIMLLSVLSAALSLDLDGEIEIETEDSRNVFTFPLKTLKPMELDNLDSKILRIVAESSQVRINDLISMLEINKTSAWRRLERLKEMGLLTKDANRAYNLTELGLSRA